jgi:hypothetical protein
MGAHPAKDKPSMARRAFTPATPLPPPYQLAIEDMPFQLTVLDEHGAHDYDRDCALVPPTWFSLAVTAPSAKRYLYLVQQETETGIVVLIMLFDRSADPATGDEPRLPPSGGWLRAVVDGTVYVLASDLVLTRKAITAWIGGREPPTTPARPPYT